MDNLIDKFINGNLNESEKIQLEELLTNIDFAEQTYLNLILKQSFQKDDNSEFLDILKEVEQIHYSQQTYTLEELLSFFSPIEEYEENLSAVARASDMNIVHPKNHVNCVDNLYFELNPPNQVPLLLIIENNEYDVLIRKEIPAHQHSFTIPLSLKKGFKVGRYYWKLASKRHEFSLMGVFFIGKDLMSSNS